MKNVIKKIAATAMAFTLLGTGTTISKNISPNSLNTIIANAKTGEWNYWDYPVPDYRKCYGYGSRGKSVKWIQCYMNFILDIDLAVDGIYGSKTKEAVKNFQKKVNNDLGRKELSVDGIFGPETLNWATACDGC